MGLFGGSSKSTSMSNQIDNRMTGGEGANIISGDGNSISFLDGGAIAESYKFADSTIEGLTSMFNGLLSSVDKSTEKVLSANTQGMSDLLNMSKSAEERTLGDLAPMIMGSVSLIAIVLIWRTFK